MKILTLFLLLVVTAAAVSCSKVVDINLNASDSKYVIEGNVTDQPGQYEVRISKTVNFDDSNDYPAVRHALVTIRDSSLGITDTLTEGRAGSYITHTITGVCGHFYQLSVSIAGETFTARSIMPGSVRLDTLVQGTGGFSHSIQVTPVYTDPGGIANYYLFWVTRNDTLQDDIIVRNDVGSDGTVASRPLRTEAVAGDVVVVEMQCIDKAIYDYFYGLAQDVRQTSATPSNPVSNISGGCLGYFSAHTTQRETITIR